MSGEVGEWAGVLDMAPALPHAMIENRVDLHDWSDMAEAAVKYAEPVSPPVESVTLTLSHDEAVAVKRVLGKVGGSSYDSPREHIDAVWDALGRAGIHYKTWHAERFLTGSMTFKDGSVHD